MDTGNYSKRNSCFEESAATPEVEAHNSKKTEEETQSIPTIIRKNKNMDRKLSVTFSTKNDIYEISRRTKEEKVDMHMSREDQKLIIQEMSNAMHRYYFEEQNQLKGVYVDDSNRKCIEDLGLERIIEQQDAGRIKRMKSAVYVILQRQRKSRLFDSCEKETKSIDENWLQKHYRPLSKTSANLARSRGIRDQEMSPYLFPRKNVMVR